MDWTESEAAVIQRDKQQYPDCSYSSSMSESCSTQEDGKFVCEIIKNLSRLCPGENPVTVLSRKETVDNPSSSDSSIQHHSWSSSSSHSSWGDIDAHSIFRGGEGIFGNIFGSSTRRGEQQPNNNEYKHNDPMRGFGHGFPFDPFTMLDGILNQIESQHGYGHAHPSQSQPQPRDLPQFGRQIPRSRDYNRRDPNYSSASAALSGNNNSDTKIVGPVEEI